MFDSIDEVVAGLPDFVILEVSKSKNFNLSKEEISNREDMTDFLNWWLHQHDDYKVHLERFVGKESFLQNPFFPANVMQEALYIYMTMTGKVPIKAKVDGQSEWIKCSKDLYLLLKNSDQTLKSIYRTTISRKKRAEPEMKSLMPNFKE